MMKRTTSIQIYMVTKTENRRKNIFHKNAEATTQKKGKLKKKIFSNKPRVFSAKFTSHLGIFPREKKILRKQSA